MTAYVQQDWIEWYASWCSSCEACTLSLLLENGHSMMVQAQKQANSGGEQEWRKVFLLVCLSLCKHNLSEAHTRNSLCSLQVIGHCFV